MVSKIAIVCFDINNEGSEDWVDSFSENLFTLESPLRILDEFLEKKIFLNSEKSMPSSSEIKYTFQACFSGKNIIIEITVLYDLTYIHEISLYADAYLLFANLENINTKAQLDKITLYILESCSLDTKTYILGIYNDKIIPSLNKESMELYFEEESLEYEYHQIKYRNNHLNLNIDEDKENNQNNYQNQIEVNSNLNLFDSFLKILKKIYELKIKEIYRPIKKKLRFNSFSSTLKDFGERSKSDSKNGCNCTVF